MTLHKVIRYAKALVAVASVKSYFVVELPFHWIALAAFFFLQPCNHLVQFHCCLFVFSWPFKIIHLLSFLSYSMNYAVIWGGAALIGIASWYYYSLFFKKKQTNVRINRTICIFIEHCVIVRTMLAFFRKNQRKNALKSFFEVFGYRIGQQQNIQVKP